MTHEEYLAKMDEMSVLARELATLPPGRLHDLTKATLLQIAEEVRNATITEDTSDTE